MEAKAGVKTQAVNKSKADAVGRARARAEAKAREKAQIQAKAKAEAEILQKTMAEARERAKQELRDWSPVKWEGVREPPASQGISQMPPDSDTWDDFDRIQFQARRNDRPMSSASE